VGKYSLQKISKTANITQLKKLTKKKLSNNGISEIQIKREINIHRRLRHDNIVTLFSDCEDENYYYLIMDYINKGNLYQTITLNNGLSEEKAFKYFIQVVAAVKFLHDNCLIHRDIKPENLLINDADEVKLCDFDWCVEIKDTNRVTFCGTF